MGDVEDQYEREAEGTMNESGGASSVASDLGDVPFVTVVGTADGVGGGFVSLGPCPRTDRLLLAGIWGGCG